MNEVINPALIPSLHIFARAGGGGSGSGGSGGGGIALIGYVPMHLLGAFLRRHSQRHKVAFLTVQVIGWIIAAVYAVLLLIVLHFIGAICAVAAILGMGAGLYNWFSKIRQSKQTKQALRAAAEQDPMWNESTIAETARATFLQYQKDWTNYDANAMKAYLTPSYQYHAGLMIYALQLAARQDIVGSPVIKQLSIVGMNNATDSEQDAVLVAFTAQANDQLIDTRDKKQLYLDTSEFNELWKFKRSGKQWLLDGIQPATANVWMGNYQLQSFAAEQGFCYSLDWGWLLLPRNGQLFGEGKFGSSDINNHVIGMYSNILIQLYNYRPNAHTSKNYLIAQANLPKSYGDIVVRHKSGLHLFGIKGLTKVSMEWQKFNDSYEVFASDIEKVTSFELLHPVYMEQLQALPFEVNIEVVDNVVYLYAPARDKNIVPDRYKTMLALLREAFKQMQL